jgi:nucleotide-binding universal stress UspA family protein
MGDTGIAGEKKKKIIVAVNTSLENSGGYIKDPKELLREHCISEEAAREIEDFIARSIDWIRGHYRKAEVELLYVLDEAVLHDLADRKLAEEAKNHACMDGGELLERVRREYSSNGISITTKIRYGNPVEEVCSEARETRAYNVLVAARRDKTTRKAFLRRIVEDIMEKTPCPVVIITPKQERLSDRGRRRIKGTRKKLLSKGEAG